MYKENIGANEIYLSIGQACLPIIMLALSIMVSGAKYGARADKMHLCAQELNYFKKLLNYEIEDANFSPSPDKFRKYAEQYSEMLSKYENHSKVDLSIESIRSLKKPRLIIPLVELIAALIGRGLIYYLYILISVMSVGWMALGAYLVIKGVVSC